MPVRRPSKPAPAPARRGRGAPPRRRRGASLAWPALAAVLLVGMARGASGCSAPEQASAPGTTAPPSSTDPAAVPPTTAPGAGGGKASPTTKQPTSASTTKPKSTSTTTAPPTTAKRSPTTTAAPTTPEGFARDLFQAWKVRNRRAAAAVASPAAIDALFAHTDAPVDSPDGPADYAFAGCTGAAGSEVCRFDGPTGDALVMKVRTPTGGLPMLVTEVKFAS